MRFATKCCKMYRFWVKPSATFYITRQVSINVRLRLGSQSNSQAALFIEK